MLLLVRLYQLRSVTCCRVLTLEKYTRIANLTVFNAQYLGQNFVTYVMRVPTIISIQVIANNAIQLHTNYLAGIVIIWTNVLIVSMGSNWFKVNVFLARLNSALDVTLIWINVLNVKKDFTLAKVCADHVQVSAKSV